MPITSSELAGIKKGDVLEFHTNALTRKYVRGKIQVTSDGNKVVLGKIIEINEKGSESEATVGHVILLFQGEVSFPSGS